jgi:hypothetical protein
VDLIYYADTLYKPSLSKNPRESDLFVSAESQVTFKTELLLPSGVDRSVTYLKVFISTQYVDLSHLEMTSPFTRESLVSHMFEHGQHSSSVNVRGSADAEHTGALRLRGGALVVRKRPEIWSCLSIPILQRVSEDSNVAE